MTSFVQQKAEAEMRLLFITWDGPQVAYLESLFVPIFARLKDHGIHTDVLQFRWGPWERLLEVQKVCKTAGIGYRSAPIRRWAGGAGSFATAATATRHVRAAIRQFGSDVLMPRSVLPSLVLLLGRLTSELPILLDADGLEIDERVEFAGLRTGGLTHRILRWSERELVRRASSVITRTEASRDLLAARGGVPREKFTVVTNGRDKRLFHPFEARIRHCVRSELEVPSDAPLLIYAGSVGRRYRTYDIGRLAALVQKARPDSRLLVLTGEPREAAELLGGSAPRASFTTIMRAPPTDVPRYLAAGDVGTSLIEPSFSTRGIAPVKTGEYLLCGLPVVGTAGVGNNGPAISAGVFFDATDALEEAAAWIVGEVLPRREEMRRAARAVGEAHYGLDSTVAGYLEAIRLLKHDQRSK